MQSHRNNERKQRVLLDLFLFWRSQQQLTWKQIWKVQRKKQDELYRATWLLHFVKWHFERQAFVQFTHPLCLVQPTPTYQPLHQSAWRYNTGYGGQTWKHVQESDLLHIEFKTVLIRKWFFFYLNYVVLGNNCNFNSRFMRRLSALIPLQMF